MLIWIIATSPIQIHSPVATPCESECEDEMGAHFELPKRQQKKIKRRRRKESDINRDTLNESRKLRKAPEYQQHRDEQSQTQSVTTTLSHIYIGGLHRETDDLDVKQHLDEMGIKDSEVRNLSNGNTNNDRKSYKISVSSEQLDQVMCEDNWPASVRARTFLPKRTHQSFREYRERPNANGDNNKPTRQAHGTHERRRPNIHGWHNDDITGEPHNAQRGNNIRRRSNRYDEPSQDGDWVDARRRPNIRVRHNDDITGEPYNAQRGNNIRRRSYRYDEPSQDGDWADARRRPNKRACHDDESRRDTYYNNSWN